MERPERNVGEGCVGEETKVLAQLQAQGIHHNYSGQFFLFWGRGCFVVLWLDFSNGGFVHVCMHVCVSARARAHTRTHVIVCFAILLFQEKEKLFPEK